MKSLTRHNGILFHFFSRVLNFRVVHFQVVNMTDGSPKIPSLYTYLKVPAESAQGLI